MTMAMASASCLLLPPHPSSTSTSSFLLNRRWLLQQPPPVLPSTSATTLRTAITTMGSVFLPPLPLHVCGSSKLDPNAESQRFGLDNDDEEDEDEVEKWVELFEDYIDSIWIFKVFRSYGWLLPFILLSLLTATGLKAFLMALSLPIAQSTVSFAFQRMTNWGKRKPKRKSRTRKRRPRAGKDDQSWIPRNNNPAASRGSNASSFRGWDELVTRRPSPIESPGSSAENGSRLRKPLKGKGKVSRDGRKSDNVPLLLRLLVAVFPFLESWTMML